MASSVSTASTVGAWHGGVTIATPGAAGWTRSVTLQHAVVGEVLEQTGCRRRQRQSRAGSTRHRDDHVLDRGRIDREPEATERVEVLQSDAVDLGVATEVREQAQRLDRAGVLGPELG